MSLEMSTKITRWNELCKDEIHHSGRYRWQVWRFNRYLMTLTLPLRFLFPFWINSRLRKSKSYHFSKIRILLGWNSLNENSLCDRIVRIIVTCINLTSRPFRLRSNFQHILDYKSCSNHRKSEMSSSTKTAFYPIQD